MKMKKYNHLAIARLEERVLNVVVQNVDLVASDRSVSESVGVGLESTGHSLAHDVRPNVQVLQPRVTLVRRQNKRVLLDQIFLFSLLGFPVFELFLHLLYQPEGGVQVRRGR